MLELLQNYGLWVALAAVFFAMHRFGMGCCGGIDHGPRRRAEQIAGAEGEETPGTVAKSDRSSQGG